jgi:DNA polymerase-3 subunit delta
LPKYKDVFFSFLKKQKYAAVFNSLSNTEATAWAKKEIASRGGKITASAATLLAGFLGSDLWRMSNEIDKLINYKAGQKLKLDLSDEHVAINNEDVESLVRGNFDEKIFALTDAISNKNKSLAIKLLEDQIDAGLTDIYLLSMIARQFKILLRVRQALDSGMTPRQISSVLKIHPFVAQKGIAQARNFTLHVLRDMLKRIIEIEYNMKTGKSDVKSALDLLLVKL